MTAALYIPQPGTIPARVIDWLRQQTPHTWHASAVIGDALDIDRNLGPYMTTPMREGLVATEKRKGVLYWTLGNGKPVKPAVDDEPDEAPIVRRHIKLADEPLNPPTSPVEKIDIPPELVSVPPPPKADADIVTANIPDPSVYPFKCAIWSDETLQVQLPCGSRFELSPEDTKVLAGYLEQHVESGT